ncbi:unnamed protein product [marine sediment metagenome]|uniref:Uncharacterized protein n=1 Tax=marine sediment metagenome TaxID=412755 RepID=X1DAN8_9ZZZZ
MANAVGTLLQRFQQQEESAKAANIQRYEQAMQIYDEIISRYRPGGEFGRAALGQLEARKVTDVGRETQQLISSGLYGTTTMGAIGRRWEEAVPEPLPDTSPPKTVNVPVVEYPNVFNFAVSVKTTTIVATVVTVH